MVGVRANKTRVSAIYTRTRATDQSSAFLFLAHVSPFSSPVNPTPALSLTFFSYVSIILSQSPPLPLSPFSSRAASTCTRARYARVCPQKKKNIQGLSSLSCFPRAQQRNHLPDFIGRGPLFQGLLPEHCLELFSASLTVRVFSARTVFFPFSRNSVKKISVRASNGTTFRNFFFYTREEETRGKGRMKIPQISRVRRETKISISR